jgi:hypothetical protein
MRDNTQAPKRNGVIPALAADAIRIIPLGGVEEIGRNMTAVEFGNDIIVVDCGFGFGESENTPGVDYILPNTGYLEENRDKIRALIVSQPVNRCDGRPALRRPAALSMVINCRRPRRGFRRRQPCRRGRLLRRRGLYALS